jgi:signal transduction histidine kinase/DNA-binding response OmpR family regulator
MNNLPAEKNRRVLIIDDNHSIHDDFRKILSPSDQMGAAIAAAEMKLFGSPINPSRQTRFEVDSAYQGQEGLLLVKQAREGGRPYAVAFVDVRMPPGWDGVETTQKIWAVDPEIQIVLCTAYSDYSWDEMLEKIGNDDRMVILKKPFDTVEAFQLAHAFSEKWWLHRLSRQKMEDLEAMVAGRTRELSSKTAFLEAQVNSSIDGILVLDGQGRKILQNQRLADLLKIPPPMVADEDPAKQIQWMANMMKNPGQFLEKIAHLDAHPEAVSHDEVELKDKTILDQTSSPVIGPDGKHYGRTWTFRDITERRRLEAGLFQSQKMETVGRLAGGVAHEFNNIMTAIIGQSELMLFDLPPESPLGENARAISKSAQRAAALTRQLLAYGRKQIFRLEILDLNAVLAGMETALGHLVGRNVEVRIAPAAGLNVVKADAGQIEQVIINMAMNAADAMPNGGKLTLETANVTLDQEYVRHFPELRAGEYVLLAIADTGAGMSEEVKARVFEPFFSTKGVGQGTGLGLATCHGILKQSGGHINVYSEPARGTTFKIYLPQAEPPAKAPAPSAGPSPLPHGTETILLVEDDSALREMAETLLRRLGYTVLTAINGVEALSLIHQQGTGHIDLLFTDIVMPHMGGKELADRVHALFPHTKILFTSAYTENAIVHQGVLNEGVVLLQKPFTLATLAFKLRAVLDR